MGGACVGLVLGACQMAGRAPDAPSGQPGLSSLRVTGVTGGEGLYPAFEPGILHYAVRCADGTALQVAAEAGERGAALFLPHDGSAHSGSAQASVQVNENHDVAIEVRDSGGTTTYVVHCIPADFPDIVIEKRTAAVADGLLLMTPSVRDRTQSNPPSFVAIVDNNGVPRWVLRPNRNARNFRRYPDGRYSYAERRADGTEPTVVLDAGFNRMDEATLSGNLDPGETGGHDFLILDNGNYLVMSYYPTPRDFSGVVDCTTVERCMSDMGEETDSVVQEVTPAGDVVLEWNSWDHVKIADCTVHRFPWDYAHLNSLHELDGDIVAGLRGCNQVLLLERDTGAVKWQMGGSVPMRADRPQAAAGPARFLPLAGDPLGEFCGQHHVTATPEGRVLMFDNGSACHGARKQQRITRVVQYDISSGTAARWVREYRLPAADGFAASGGGVTELANGNWLITWGGNVLGPDGVALEAPVAVSEVDRAGSEVLRIRMERAGKVFNTARVYRERESDLAIPLNLPERNR